MPTFAEEFDDKFRAARGRVSFQRRHNKANGKTPSSVDWLGKCETDKQGKPFPNLANAMIALRSDPSVPPKAEVRGSNPFGRASIFKCFRKNVRATQMAPSAECPRNRFLWRSRCLADLPSAEGKREEISRKRAFCGGPQ
jgi:hypothetical protein